MEAVPVQNPAQLTTTSDSSSIQPGQHIPQGQVEPTYSLNTGGIVRQKIEEELAALGGRQDHNSKRIRKDLLGFDENMPRLSNIMASDPNFGLFDFLPKKRVDRVDMGPIEPEMHYDLFDGIRVDNQLPFVVMNLNLKKITTVKGLYLSDDRVFKLYHSKDIDVQHEDLIKDWSTSNKLNVPYSMRMKVLLHPLFRNGKNSYVDVYYTFGEGLFIEFNNQTGDSEHVLSVLRSHITGFNLKSTSIVSISGSFVVDRLLVDPTLFRGILMETHDFRQILRTQYDLRLYQFLWPNERGTSLALRTQFILNFKLADIMARIIISEKETKTSDLFYMNGIPIRFNQGTRYDLIRISDVKSVSHISIIRETIAMAFYLYGVASPSGIKSMNWGNYFNILVGKNIYTGAGFGPSKRITSKDLESTDKVNARLRAVDPTFYGSIPTGKLISKGARQPNPIVRTDDPNWQQRLQEIVISVHQDSPSSRRQIIRYPFTIINPSETDSNEEIVAKVPPYFLICNEDSPYFKIKENQNPTGGDGTYHPHLILCTGTLFINTPGSNDPASQYAYLADLSRPYPIEMITKQKTSNRGDHKYITLKVLQNGRLGIIPDSLKVVLEFFYSHPSKLDLTFERYGSPRSNLSLLHVLVSNCVALNRAELRNGYIILADDVSRINYLEDVVKRAIAKETNWNMARQELFDMEPVEDGPGAPSIQTLFLTRGAHMDSRLFRAVLEKFFNMFILIINFDKKTTKVELPRHKFLHISPIYQIDVQPIVIFKHSDSNYSFGAQYELVRMTAKPDPQYAAQVLPWTFNETKYLFDLANKTLDLSFLTVHRLNEKLYETGPVVKTQANLKPMLTDLFNVKNIQYQYIDGAGKARAMVYTFDSELHGTGGITVSFEPMCPIGIDAFDSLSLIRSGYDVSKFLLPEDFDRALAFVRSLGLKDQDLAYRLLPDDVEYVSDVIEDPADKYPVGAAVTTIISSDKGKEEITRTSSPVNSKNKSLKSTAKPRIRQVKKHETYEPLAIGIWFVYRDVQFFIATDPGQIPQAVFGINNTTFFEIEPEKAVFKQHDYFERVMNVMVQLLRNLYIYSRTDDPDFFMQSMTVVRSNPEYEISTIRRRIPTTRVFKTDLFTYCDIYPSFFTELTAEMKNGTDIQLPRMILDSKKTYKGLYQHLQAVQKLKQNIIGASGSKVIINEPANSQEIRTVSYIPYLNGILYPDNISNGITDAMITHIVRLEEYYNRPGYIEEYYVYPSDYAVRGPDQHVFTSEDEIKQYMNLLELETTNSVMVPPLAPSTYLIKTPVYLVLRDGPNANQGSLYVLQNVMGGSLKRAQNVLYAWDNERINLGYYAEEFQGAGFTSDQINVTDLNKFDTSNNGAIVGYFAGQYAALFRLSGSVAVPAH